MTSLKIILKSKFNKSKRKKHIAQMERELGLVANYSIDDKPEVTWSEVYRSRAEAEYQKAVREDRDILKKYESSKHYEVKKHYDPLTFELLRSKNVDRENIYVNIEHLLHGYYFTDAGTAKDIHSKYRRYDGTLFLHWDGRGINLINCSFQFVNECKDKLEFAGFKVNVLDMDRIKWLCPGIEFKSVDV